MQFLNSEKVMLEEKVIYERSNVKITNLRAIFGDKTYAISNITSVTKKRKQDADFFEACVLF